MVDASSSTDSDCTARSILQFIELYSGYSGYLTDWRACLHAAAIYLPTHPTNSRNCSFWTAPAVYQSSPAASCVEKIRSAGNCNLQTGTARFQQRPTLYVNVAKIFPPKSGVLKLQILQIFVQKCQIWGWKPHILDRGLCY